MGGGESASVNSRVSALKKRTQSMLTFLSSPDDIKYLRIENEDAELNVKIKEEKSE